LRVELLTTNKPGIAFACDTEAENPWLESKGIVANWHVAKKFSDAKVELVWNDACVGNRNLWPAHHLWLRLALEELTSALLPALNEKEARLK
jgi:hypothetical protein